MVRRAALFVYKTPCDTELLHGLRCVPIAPPRTHTHTHTHTHTGYFAALGHAKKGGAQFLIGSLKRLGPPWLLFFFALNPLNYYVAYLLAGLPYAYLPDSSHAWFLTWLMVFNCCYAIFEHTNKSRSTRLKPYSPPESPSDPESGSPAAPPSSPIPGFGRIALICLAVGVVQFVPGVLLLYSGVINYAGMPMTTAGDGLSCALFYAAGNPNPNPTLILTLTLTGGPVRCFTPQESWRKSVDGSANRCLANWCAARRSTP